MDEITLAGLVKRVYPHFNVETFENRLKLQKLFFFLKNCGIDLGYNFGLYIRGPYCPELTRDAFQVQDWEVAREVIFDNSEIEDKFLECINKFKDYKDDVTWLEVATTLILIKKDYSYKKEECIQKLKDLKPNYKDYNIDEVYNKLIDWRWINEGVN